MKYMGSKARHGKEILDVIFNTIKKEDYENWVEPFVGGANMIDKVTELNRYGNDSNKYLIALFQEIQKGYEPPEYVTDEEYKDIRNLKEWYPAHFVGFVGIGCSYSGKWFGGFARNVGKEKPDAEVLFKTSRNYCAESKRNILKQSEFIKDVIFTSGDYRQMTIPSNSIIYCDPPYAGTTSYKDSFNHDSFWSWCNEQIEKGHRVFVSEYSAPSDWRCIWQKEVNNTLTKDTGSKKGIEKLFTK